MFSNSNLVQHSMEYTNNSDTASSQLISQLGLNQQNMSLPQKIELFERMS